MNVHQVVAFRSLNIGEVAIFILFGLINRYIHE